MKEREKGDWKTWAELDSVRDRDGETGIETEIARKKVRYDERARETVRDKWDR